MANQVNLQFQDAAPLMADRLTRSLSNLFES
jgi:hypothetical protein